MLSSFRAMPWLLASLGCGVSTLVAQEAPQLPADREASAISLAIGSGGAESDWFDGLYGHDFGGGPVVEDDLGGLVVSLRMVFLRTPLLPSRLRLGGEVGVFMIMDGDAVGQNTNCGPGCQLVWTNPPTRPDDAGIHLGPIASLRVFSAGPVSLRLEGGAGMVVFNLDEAGPGQQMNNQIEFMEGEGYFESTPGPELYMTGRIVPSIGLISSPTTSFRLAIDPYLTWLQTTGDVGIRSLTFGGALSFQW